MTEEQKVKEKYLKDEVYLSMREETVNRLLKRKELNITREQADEVYFKWAMRIYKEQQKVDLPGLSPDEQWEFYRDSFRDEEEYKDFLVELTEPYLKPGYRIE